MKKQINEFKETLKKEILNARKMRDICDRKHHDKEATLYWAGNLAAFKISLKNAQNLVSK